jgi:hypothetical protein
MVRGLLARSKYGFGKIPLGAYSAGKWWARYSFVMGENMSFDVGCGGGYLSAEFNLLAYTAELTPAVMRTYKPAAHE